MTDTADPTGLPAGAIPLADGHWAVLEDYHELNGADTAEILLAITAGNVSSQMHLALIKRLVKNTSIPGLSYPLTDASFRFIPAASFAKLLAAVRPAYRMVNGVDVAPVFDEHTFQDPASPTAGSSE